MATPVNTFYPPPSSRHVMSGADERAAHPEGAAFCRYFTALLLLPGRSCWERDVLRASKEALWANWKLHAEGEP